MQYRWSSNSRATTDSHGGFEEVAMRRKCPDNIPAEMSLSDWLTLSSWQVVGGKSNWVSLVCVRQTKSTFWLGLIHAYKCSYQLDQVFTFREDRVTCLILAAILANISVSGQLINSDHRADVKTRFEICDAPTEEELIAADCSQKMRWLDHIHLQSEFRRRHRWWTSPSCFGDSRI